MKISLNNKEEIQFSNIEKLCHQQTSDKGNDEVCVLHTEGI